MRHETAGKLDQALRNQELSCGRRMGSENGSCRQALGEKARKIF